MKEILIFAGTTEGRKLSESLAASGINHTLCVATEYGEIVLKENSFMTVHRGRMDEEQIREFIQNGKFEAVVDATHPYANIVTNNIKSAMEEMNIPYLRLKRELNTSQKEENVTYFETNEACAKELEEIQGNILLTTGSKELKKYCVSEDVKNRLFVRVLPGMESLSLCMEQGIKGKQIIAMQGPFTTEMNEAMIRQYGISCLITKQSGTSGGYYEKLEAAKKTGISV
ncbi:MAG: precorrin-6A reductase, partial [Lachnospiraceae bacterium]|nr:precorrin-6A reductase [Lachnospiraceae bacterium]